MDYEYASCSRCRRPAPPELNGPPSDAKTHDYAAWEVFVGTGEDPEEDDVLVCPQCLTGVEFDQLAHAFDDLDPLLEIPRLVARYEAGAISGSEYENALAEQGLLVEALSGSPDAAEAQRLLNEACSKLPPESIGDLLAKAYHVLDEHRDVLSELAEDEGDAER